jgi:hypothetical protein
VARRSVSYVEMARVLKTKPVSMASDPSSGAITFWKHDPLHDVVAPMGWRACRCGSAHLAEANLLRSQRVISCQLFDTY